jgi:hypothetical protein
LLTPTISHLDRPRNSLDEGSIRCAQVRLTPRNVIAEDKKGRIAILLAHLGHGFAVICLGRHDKVTRIFQIVATPDVDGYKILSLGRERNFLYSGPGSRARSKYEMNLIFYVAPISKLLQVFGTHVMTRLSSRNSLKI